MRGARPRHALVLSAGRIPWPVVIVLERIELPFGSSHTPVFHCGALATCMILGRVTPVSLSVGRIL